MKYLMLFEAFETNAISKVIDFIKNKVGPSESESFLKNLRKAQKALDFPLHKISDKDIDYLNSKKALKVNKEDEVNNEKGIYCLKYWFSMEDGFIGVSGVGNEVYNFGESDHRGVGFNKSEINYIKSDKSDEEDIYNPTGLGIKTGTLKRILTNQDYQTLQHGDYVIVNLGEEELKKNITLARIYKVGNEIFAISDNVYGNGGSPGRADWREWGRYSWSLGTTRSPGSDHLNMYLYTQGKDELKIIGDKEKDEINTFEFNLPFNSSFQLRKWASYKEDDWSFKYIDNKELHGWEKIEKSDFCIVIYLEDLLKEKKPSETSKERKERKEGATHFMTDDQIKNANIDRYLSKILSKMGISKDTTELKNLQKYINATLCSDYSLFSIMSNRPGLSIIKRFQERLYKFLLNLEHYNKLDDPGEKDYWKRQVDIYFKDLLGRYKEDVKTASNYRNVFQNNYKSLFNNIDSKNHSASKELKEFFTKLKDLSEYINSYISTKEVSSISGMLFIYSKIVAINDVMGDEIMRFSSHVRNYLSDYRYNLDENDLDYFLKRVTKEDLSGDIKKLKELESFIKSILS